MSDERSQQSIGAILTSFTAGTALVWYGSFVGSSPLANQLSTPEPLSQQDRSWEGFPFSQSELLLGPSSEDWVTLFENLAHQLIEGSVPPDPEIERIITENFWELV
jgi:hypothetical protein